MNYHSLTHVAVQLTSGQTEGQFLAWTKSQTTLEAPTAHTQLGPGLYQFEIKENSVAGKMAYLTQLPAAGFAITDVVITDCNGEEMILPWACLEQNKELFTHDDACELTLMVLSGHDFMLQGQHRKTGTFLTWFRQLGEMAEMMIDGDKQAEVKTLQKMLIDALRCERDKSIEDCLSEVVTNLIPADSEEVGWVLLVSDKEDASVMMNTSLIQWLVFSILVFKLPNFPTHIQDIALNIFETAGFKDGVIGLIQSEVEATMA